MKTTPAFPVAFASLLFALLLPAEPAEGQVRSMTWTQVTQIEVPGTFGAVLRATGALNERRSDHALHVHGGTLRQDDGSTSVIFDAEGRRFITIDHEQETYMEVTFEESAQLAREMGEVVAEARAGADEALAEVQAERDEAIEELRRAMDEMEQTMSFSLRSEATGERRSFGDFTANRHVIIGEVEATGEIEGVEGEAGTLVFVVELWQSPDFPDEAAFMEEWGAALAEDPAMQALAADLAEAFEPVAGASGAELLAVWDPRIAAGASRMAEAMESLEGTTLASRTVIAAVEPGAEMNREELFAWEPASMGDQLRAGAGDAARGAAQEAARGAIRGLSRGLLGRGGGDAAEEAAEAPRVRPLVSIRSSRENPLFQTSSESGQNPLFDELERYRPISLSDLMQTSAPPG
jgi:hypothetical protein